VTPDDLMSALVAAGVNAGTVVRFDVTPGPQHVRYVDLMHASDSLACLPDAVVESAGQPFAYVVRRDRLGDVLIGNVQLQDLLRVLACRSDARYLCVVTPGAMDVYPVAIARALPAPILDGSHGQSPNWLDLLSGTAVVSVQQKTRQVRDQWVEHLLFSLLVDAARGIQREAAGLSIAQTLALVGRALFFRFLVDRGIVTLRDVASIGGQKPGLATLEDAFRTPEALVATCGWLDRTFNGDLLSLGPGGAQEIVSLCGDGIVSTCWHLSNIQHRSLGGQMELDWSGIRFRHVPVDVLSQVYEDFAHVFVPDLARQTSVHYTPRKIAEVLIDGVFSACASVPIHQAKVLDPTVGGGVFLVLALRRLVAEHWRHFGKRPARAQIRSILREQLCGWDINRDALNISALSLYLAALELDPKPSPVDDLKFEKLIGTVLIPVDAEALASSPNPSLGSLGLHGVAGLQGAFDIVVGNPPWTGWRKDVALALDECVSELAALSVPAAETPREHPVSSKSPSTTVSKGKKSTPPVGARYGSPDIAFLLAASRWAKKEGAIGFALHARFLFQTASAPLRKIVFGALRVTGVMNFSALRQDKRLWPKNDAPFALLVAQNVRPQKGDRLHFVSPRYEAKLEAAGQFRIDPAAAAPVSLDFVARNPYAFKALYKGSALGLDLLQRIFDACSSTVKELLDSEGLQLKSGFQSGKPESRTLSSTALCGLPEASVDMALQVPGDAPFFALDKLQWPRTRDIYNGPLLLFRESPKFDRELRGALFAEQDTVFSESFIGLSFARKPGLTLLRDLLYVVSYSDLLLYYQLLTSAKFGVERDSSLQAELGAFPLINIEDARTKEKEVQSLALALRQGEHCWGQVDSLVAELYGLSEADQLLIQDTLATELPFTDIRQQAGAPVSPKEVMQFVSMFNQIVEPFVGQGNAASVSMVRDFGKDGWGFLHLGLPAGTVPAEHLLNDAGAAALASVASSYWASVIRVSQPDGSELHGRLNQRRYWTRTEARQAALQWLRSSPSSN
jgi:hypothetical protein